MFFGLIGISLGSFFGGRLSSVVGMHKGLYLCMAICLIGTLCKILYLNFALLLIGRILHGFGGGSLGYLMGKAINETVPI